MPTQSIPSSPHQYVGEIIVTQKSLFPGNSQSMKDPLPVPGRRVFLTAAKEALDAKF